MSDECKVLGYIRVSGQGQADSGLSLDVQRKELLRYKEFRLPDVELGIPHSVNDDLRDGVLCDAAVSASKLKLRDRPAGKVLDSNLHTGDHVILLRVNRGWRNMADAASTLGDWLKRGITVHLATEGFAIGDKADSPLGKFVFYLLAAFAEMENECRSEAANSAKRECHTKGYWPYPVPFGYMTVGPRGHKVLTPVPSEQAIINYVQQLAIAGMKLKGIVELGIINPRTKKPFTREMLRKFYVQAQRNGEIEFNRGIKAKAGANSPAVLEIRRKIAALAKPLQEPRVIPDDAAEDLQALTVEAMDRLATDL